MNNRFVDLKFESLATLIPYMAYWSFGGQHISIQWSINHELPIETAGITYIAQYAIFYAILLDNRELLEDLHQHHADLELRDPFHKMKTPLEVAIEYGRAGIVSDLIKYGAKLPNDIKVPSSKPCSNPLRFFWTLTERLAKREVDYKSIDTLLQKKNC